MKSVLAGLARTLPDLPRWLETRSMLLSGRCEVLGLEEASPETSFVARELEESEDRLICVMGCPSAEAIEEAVKRNRNPGMVLVTPEGTSHVYDALLGWTAVRAMLHLLGESSRLRRLTEGEWSRSERRTWPPWRAISPKGCVRSWKSPLPRAHPWPPRWLMGVRSRSATRGTRPRACGTSRSTR